MPFYEYRCDRGHTFEVVQRMSDEPVTACTTCDASVQRVLHPVAVHFKGSGFYTTDYGKRKSGSTVGEQADGKKDAPDTGSSSDTGSKPASNGATTTSGSAASSGSGSGSSSSSD